MCGFPVVLSRDLELFVSQELVPKLLNVGVNVFWCLCCWVPLCPPAVSVSLVHMLLQPFHLWRAGPIVRKAARGSQPVPGLVLNLH